MKANEINWRMTGDDPNDIIAEYGDYCLRVERMNKNFFWWSLYNGNTEIDCSWHHRNSRSLETAKKACERAFRHVCTPNKEIK